MRRLYRIAFIVFVVLFAAYLGVFYLPKKLDSAPDIFCKSELIEIPAGTGEESILENVIAHDEKDGDLSHRVVIESISDFDNEMTRTAVFAVADSAGNVSRTSCRIKYTDYHSPRFSLLTLERYPSASKIDTVSNITVEDAIDGDLSNRVIALTDLTNASEGVYKYKLSVTNSAGEKSTVTVFEQIAGYDLESLPKINLDRYIVYLKKGDAFSARDLIKDVESNNPVYVDALGYTMNEVIEKDKVEISGKADTETAGEYYLCYSVKNSAGKTGYSYLTVIVEE